MRALVQRDLGLRKLQVAPGPLLNERRGERTYQAQREAEEPENVGTDGRGGRAEGRIAEGWGGNLGAIRESGDLLLYLVQQLRSHGARIG